MENENQWQWFENWIVLIDNGVNCSLNSAVNPESGIVYYVEDDGNVKEFTNYQEALEGYIKTESKRRLEK